MAFPLMWQGRGYEMVCPNTETFYSHVLLVLLLNIFKIHPSKLLVFHHNPLAYDHFLQQDKWFLESAYNFRTSIPPPPHLPIKVPPNISLFHVYLHAGNGTRGRNLKDSGLTKWDNGTEKCKGWRRWVRCKMRGVGLYGLRH